MYFDNAATTMVPNNIIDIVHYYMRWEYANSGSIHYAGMSVKNKLKQARSTIAELIGANQDQIIFTSGGSESNTLALVGLTNYLKHIEKPCVISTPIEHASVIESLKYMKNNGIAVIELSVDRNGVVDIDELEDLIETYNVGLVSVMAVNNEIGTTNDIVRIGRICEHNNILFHTDCVQAIGDRQINVKDMNIDFLSASGHKFHAPKGVGFLYARNKEILEPIIHGGGQEFSLRAGTENIPGIMGMTQALSDAYKTNISFADIKRLFVDNIQKLCKENNIDVYFNGNSDKNKSKIVNLRFPGVDGQSLVLACSVKGVCISAGSACKSTSNEPSHVLKAIGLTDDEALSSVRVSFSRYNTAQEVLDGTAIIVQCVKEMLDENCV